MDTSRSYRNSSTRLKIPARWMSTALQSLIATTSSTSTITTEQAIHSNSMVATMVAASLFPVRSIPESRAIRFATPSDSSPLPAMGTSMQQVFTIAGSELSNWKNGVYYRGVDFKFTNIPEGASIVVNVTGTNPVEFHNGWRFWWEIQKYLAVTRVSTLRKTLTRNTRWLPSPSCGTLSIRKPYHSGRHRGRGRADWGYGGATTGAKWTDDDPAAAMIGSISFPTEVSTTMLLPTAAFMWASISQ